MNDRIDTSTADSRASHEYDLTGRTFGRLTVLRKLGSRNKAVVWLCACACGNTCNATSYELVQKTKQSCGCYQHEMRHRVRAMDLTGMKFGRLKVLYRSDKCSNGNAVWVCECDCDAHTTVEVTQYRLTHGITKSCGCLRREVTRNRVAKWTTPEQQDLTRRYDNMISRCYNPNVYSYRFYGARGIFVCDEWRNDRAKFIEWSLANGYRSDLSIDRIDDNGPYAPWNCRWVNNQQQCENRQSNVMITVDGVTNTITTWSRIIGVSHQTMSNHVKSGDAEEYIRKKLSIINSTTVLPPLIAPWAN